MIDEIQPTTPEPAVEVAVEGIAITSVEVIPFAEVPKRNPSDAARVGTSGKCIHCGKLIWSGGRPTVGEFPIKCRGCDVMNPLEAHEK